MKSGIDYKFPSEQKNTALISRLGNLGKRGIMQNYKIIIGIVATLGALTFIHSNTRLISAKDLHLKKTSVDMNTTQDMMDIFIDFKEKLKAEGAKNNFRIIKVQGELITAASGSRDDIQSAVDQAVAGDIVQIPAGTFDFDGTVLVREGIHIQGAGRENTILIKTDTERTMFNFKIYNQTAPAFSAIKLKDPKGPYSSYNIYNTTVGIDLAYGCWDLKVFDCEFEGFGLAGVITREYWGGSPSVTWWRTRGVIYNNRFIDCRMPGLGYGVCMMGGRDKAWDIAFDLGSDYAVFIEDNYFSGARHAVAACDGARYVCRYNVIENHQMSAPIDAHGNPCNEEGIRATRKWEIYKNIINGNGESRGIDIRGGNGVIFENEIFNVTTAIYLCNEKCPGCGGYPCPDQVRDSYVWGNTLNGVPAEALSTTCGDPDPLIVEGRDFFNYEKLGYVPYTYPHPLRTNEPFISISTSSLEFSATASGDNLPTQTFQISNSGGGTLDWNITDDASWLSCSPTSGTGNDDIIVSVDSSGLSAGTYTCTISVSSNNAINSPQTISVTLTVTSLPLVASLVASPTSGEVPLTVSFTGSATGGTPPYTYSWSFGDSASSSSQNPSHTYSTAGDYTATLTVTDSASNQDSESVTISASATHTVTTPNTPNGPFNGSPNVSYTYTTGGSSCSHGHSVEYRFDWGDGAYSAWSSSTIASHSWPDSGIYAVKAQARCSVNHSIVSGWSSETTVTIATSSYYNLALSSATGSPTPGQGGTTDPSPGNHSYPSGNSVLVSAITNTDYRFSKWTGDVSGSDAYDEETTVSMDQNKSISAYFCTKCGDVNGDLNITPADAQEVFEIFLGIISDPTDCQKENADVNCDGTKTNPKITPGDAQAIFEKFLGINDLPGDCSCKSRAESAGSLAIQERAFVQLERSANINLIINDIELKPGKIIVVPVIIDNPSNIKAFGFDILFESEILEFVGVMRTELLKDFNEVDGNEIAQGVLRVGGYSSEPIRSYSPGALIRLIFKVTGETEEPCPFLITNTVDDLENASFQNKTYMREKIRHKDIVF